MKSALLLLVLALGFVGTVWSQAYSIDWHKIAGGGGTSTGGVFSVSGTIGQHDASGALTNAPYSVTGGFWALPIAVQIADGPTLSIMPDVAGFATLSWTPDTSGFVLQENVNLGTTNWINSPSAATNPVTLPANVPIRFYRLNKP
ncbi:MAG: hypothetical protein WCS52_18305 [bacterium]